MSSDRSGAAARSGEGPWAPASAAVLVAALLVLTPLGAERAGRAGEVLVDDAAEPAAMAGTPEGGLAYAERTGGRILRVEPDGGTSLVAGPIAVSTDGQRGLLGLAVDGAGRVFASWTEPGGRLIVGRVDVAPFRVVWRGPGSTDRATGGRLAVAPDGSLVLGVGELLEPELVDDPRTPHGKLLALDPEGDWTQRPRVLSSGWHNPFAFAFTPSGELWVADNAPGERTERLARGDLGEPASVVALPPHTVPVGLAAPDDDELVLCGRGTGVLQRYRRTGGGAFEPVGLPLAGDCALGVLVLADGRLAYATDDQIRVLELPDPAV